MTLPDLSPPQNQQAERAVIGSLLLDRGCHDDVLELLEERDFYAPANAEAYAAIVALFDRNAKIDLISVTDELTRREKLAYVGGVDYLASVTEEVPTTAHAASYAELVRESGERRRLVEAAQAILGEAARGGRPVDEILDRAEQRIFDVAQGRPEDSSARADSLMLAALEKIDALDHGENVTGGLQTGFSELDRMLNGLAPGGLYVVAGRPSMGKSSFVTSLLGNLCVQGGLKALLFTLEVTKEQVGENLLCGEAMVDVHRLMRGRASPEEMERVRDAAGRLSAASLWVDDTPGLSITRLRAKSRRLMSREGLDLLAVDYLQLLTLGRRSENRQVEISQLSAMLKQLARELRCPVIALSQLNRGVEQRQDKRPMMSDLRESGSIEQDADAVMLLYREEYYFPEKVSARGRAEVIVAKNRRGPVGTADLSFHAGMLRFHNPERFESARALSVAPPKMPGI